MFAVRRNTAAFATHLPSPVATLLLNGVLVINKFMRLNLIITNQRIYTMEFFVDVH